MQKITEQYLINNSLPDGVMVQDIKKMEFVKRKPDSKQVYTLQGYDRAEKKYCLQSEHDIGKQIYVKKGTLLFLKFDY